MSIKRILKNFGLLPASYKASCIVTTAMALAFFTLTVYCELNQQWPDSAFFNPLLIVLIMLISIKSSVLSIGYSMEYIRLHFTEKEDKYVSR